MHHPQHFQPIIDFIQAIGVPVTEQALPASTFLPGVAIRGGGLVVDADKLLWPGDLLHEAGHLAVMPETLRRCAEDDLPGVNDIEHAGEQEAMAWAYAAAVALGIPLDVLIHEDGYNGNASGLLQMYAFGVFPGLRGLCASGMTAAPGFTSDCGPLRYPQMLRWLRD
ncbi:MAG: hypothetical protein E6Q88_09650 [Lysobacteraceae bacterium]|nr:MAG: hypothetical protein E6Q88_09650 [Xanthomonadaceae bacterium]